MPKDDFAKAKRGDIARRAVSEAGFAQRERQRENAKRLRTRAQKPKPTRSVLTQEKQSLESSAHPNAKHIAAAELRVNAMPGFYDRDIMARMEAAARGSANSFYEALVMMRRKMESTR